MGRVTAHANKSSLIAFFTPFITGDINFAYGYVFAGCNLFAVFFVYFCLPETSGRSLEEIDTMFLLEVKPWKSSKWTPPKGEDLITADKLRLSNGGRDILKQKEAGRENMEQTENARGYPTNPRDVMVSGVRGSSYHTAVEQ
jgi:MFS transporter, SP family, sugar:H+ symporter